MIKRIVTKIIACPNCDTTVKCTGRPGEKKILICPGCNEKGYYTIPDVKYEFSYKNILNIVKIISPYILLIISIIMSHFIYNNDNIGISLCYLLLVPIYFFFHLDGRIPLIFAILMLIISMLALAFYKNESYANQISIYAYWLLVVGSICLLIEYIKKEWLLKIKN